MREREGIRELVTAELNDGSWWSDSEGELRGSDSEGKLKGLKGV